MLDMENIKRDLKADLKPRKIVRAALIPQFKGLATPLKDVFAIFVRMIGLMFVQAKLIDADHPAMTGLIKGPGAIWQMIVDGSTRLEFKKEKARQLMVFYCVVGMIVFSILSVITFALDLGVQKSHAQGIFQPTNESTSVSEAFLNSMFQYGQAGNSYAGGIGASLGNLLALYNTGILVLASLMALWSIVSMLVDSAHHGQWGGQRHSALYAPIRLVFAIGLLVPITNGFNTAQLLTVIIAQAGSGLATTVWNQFSTSLFDNVATPPAYGLTNNVNENITALYSIAVCQAEAKALATSNGNTPPTDPAAGNALGVPYTPVNITGPGINATVGTVQSYVYSFDAQAPGDGLCGSVTIPAFDPNAVPGVAATVWATGSGNNDGFANFYENNIVKDPAVQQAVNDVIPPGSTTPPVPATTNGSISALTAYHQNLLSTATYVSNQFNTYDSGAASPVGQLQTQATNQGWVTAGALFLKATQLASTIYNAENIQWKVNPPSGGTTMTPGQQQGLYYELYQSCFANPFAFGCNETGKKVRAAVLLMNQGMQQAQAATGVESVGADGTPVDASKDSSNLLSRLADMGINQITATIAGQTNNGNPMPSTASGFGTPLMDLIALGNVILSVDAAAMVGTATLGASIVGLAASIILMPICAFLFGIAITFCVLIPLLPAVRFFFGVLTWLLTIFEALLGLPVVALWHLNSQGEGLLAHGKEGYLLILQMMLRPVLMIFGLVGGIMAFDTIFNLIYLTTLGQWWSLPAGTMFTGIGQYLSFFGYLGFYAAFVYTVANLCFGLVNTIPDRILIWIGSGGITSLNSSMEAEDSMARGAMGAYRGIGNDIMQRRLASGNRKTPPAGEEVGAVQLPSPPNPNTSSGTNIPTEGGGPGGGNNPMTFYNPAGIGGGYGATNTNIGYSGAGPGGGGTGNPSGTTGNYNVPQAASGQALGQSFQTFGSSNGYANAGLGISPAGVGGAQPVGSAPPNVSNIPTQPGAEGAATFQLSPTQQSMVEAFGRITPSVQEQSPEAPSEHLDTQEKQADASLNDEVTKDSSQISQEKSEAIQQVAAAKSSTTNGAENAELQNSPSAPVVGGMGLNARTIALRQKFLDRGDNELEP